MLLLFGQHGTYLSWQTDAVANHGLLRTISYLCPQ